MQAHSPASYLFASGLLCFSWCEAFRKNPSPMRLNATIGKSYHELKNDPKYRPEPLILTVGMLGVLLCVAGTIAGIRNLFN
jgi:hypothetical protein